MRSNIQQYQILIRSWLTGVEYDSYRMDVDLTMRDINHAMQDELEVWCNESGQDDQTLEIVYTLPFHNK